tara:strand:+ start:2256 stop:3170 length:915 start_codon:yes stop_codon:yes gene_type:complete
MHKKTTIYVKLLIVGLFSLSSCVSGCTTISLTKGNQREILPRKSFVQIQQSVEVEGCGVDRETKESRCQKAVMKYVSSGAYVFHSEVSQGTSYVLTAGHSCQSKLPKEQFINGFKVRNLGSKFKAIDLNGFQHDAEVININNRFDLCLLRVSDVLMNPPILKVADEEPVRGETVTNMAAPHGLFWPGTVLIFKGQFSGYHNRGYSVYTIPTKPGSSGSPILNKNNKLVGMIFAGYGMMENIGLSSPLIAIKVFLKKSIAMGEMKLWEKTNKPSVNTQIDKVWMEKMKTKLEQTFGDSKYKPYVK